ncbi:MAG: phosphodiester glycosidase family protein [Pseudonocardiaceae bacterium]|nr:phosphodiester glycosidase family protein [Pseudonocardiaceae bacterium]
MGRNLVGSRRSAAVAVLALLAPLLFTGTATGQPTLPPDVADPERILDTLLPQQRLAPGVTQRDFTTTEAAGRVEGHLVEVDLANPRVSTDLLTPGAVAARATVPRMADGAGAVAGINGDFFDLGGTSAAAGPQIKGGRTVKSAVPVHRRLAPPVDGASTEYVFGAGPAGLGRIDRLRFQGTARSEGEVLPLAGLNQYAIPVGGIGVFSSDWGSATRAGSVCGSNSDPDTGCSPATAVVVRGAAVVAVRDDPRAGPIPPGTQILVGRDGGARALAALQVGDDVDISYQLVSQSGRPLHFAVGGSPILRDGAPTAELGDSERAPRSAVGVGPDGRRMYLVAVDGRQSDSVGVTLEELAGLLEELTVDDAVNLDGGGSSTLVYREPGQSQVSVVNDPSGSAPRMVPNGIGVFVR